MTSKGITIKDALAYARIHIGRPVTKEDFQTVIIGKNVVNTLFYRVPGGVDYPPTHRMTVFVNGKARMGEIL